MGSVFPAFINKWKIKFDFPVGALNISAGCGSPSLVNASTSCARISDSSFEVISDGILNKETSFSMNNIGGTNSLYSGFAHTPITVTSYHETSVGVWSLVDTAVFTTITWAVTPATSTEFTVAANTPTSKTSEINQQYNFMVKLTTNVPADGLIKIDLPTCAFAVDGGGALVTSVSYPNLFTALVPTQGDTVNFNSNVFINP
jgi:hypothetical protein